MMMKKQRKFFFDQIKDYFDYIMKLISFSNKASRLFFQLQPQLKLNQILYILFSVTSTKYQLNEFNFYLQILLGKIPSSDINLKEKDIKIFYNSKDKFYSFYTETLLQEFDKQKQIGTDQNNELIQIVNEIVKMNIRNKITLDNYNKICIYCIRKISKSIQKQQQKKILMIQHQDKFINYKFICFIRFIHRSLYKTHLNQKSRRRIRSVFNLKILKQAFRFRYELFAFKMIILCYYLYNI
ncbi:unnamed protein product [Paramecium sonneborni]|uniref:Uncharacterized protein n=1 Tax=Paramecium sonneborni TaxID=65129 RepID=A0A8S1RNW6_9CILI|nr:unnamed protein product [Paramecium sonneborni]